MGFFFQTSKLKKILYIYIHVIYFDLPSIETLQDIPANFLFSHLVRESYLGQYFPHFYRCTRGSDKDQKYMCIYVSSGGWLRTAAQFRTYLSLEKYVSCSTKCLAKIEGWVSYTESLQPII